VTLKSWLEVTEDPWNWYHSKAWLCFLFAFHRYYGAMLYRLRDIATYWSKIGKFLFSALAGMTRLEFREDVWYW